MVYRTAPFSMTLNDA